MKILVIGAGFGGLSAALELSRRGFDVTVLEAHIYPGGSAGTFFHQGYQFDAGATLAGGFSPGSVMDRFSRLYNLDWQARSDSKAMLVHLGDGSLITRWTDLERWKEERIRQFGTRGESFWEWQESTADALWDFALRLPPWLPQSVGDISELAIHASAWMGKARRRGQGGQIGSIIPDAFRTVSRHLPTSAEKLRQFVDAQLLISAQTTSEKANALYGSVALDLARQGVAHIPGGMGSMADVLVSAIEGYGGEVLFRQEVVRVARNKRGQLNVEVKRGRVFQADVVVLNLPPWNITQILEGKLPVRFRNLPETPQSGWGAFMVYVGLDGSQFPDDLPLHHQVIVDEPLGEGNSLFLSLSPAWDQSRAPHGKRALTISTHTNLATWWNLFNTDRSAYDERKDQYVERMLGAAERGLPGLKSAAELLLPGTPVTFQRFTRRYMGWVGGFPQTSLFRAWGPRISRGVWMVGDAVFPGQSVPAVMLAGLRVAQAIESGAAQVLPGAVPVQRSPLDRVLDMG